MSRGDEFFEAYRWLRDALEPLCDEVRMEVFDFGQAFVVAVKWGKGDHRIRTAIRAEYGYHEGGEWISSPPDEDGYSAGYWEGGEGKHSSVNEKIQARILTREQVIDSFLSKRPAGWKK